MRSLSEPFRDKLTSDGIRIIGARIGGDIDLHNARLNRTLMIEQSRIEGDVDISAARTDSDIGFIGSRVAGGFAAYEFYGALSMLMNDAEFQQEVLLTKANIATDVDMSGVTCDADIRADTLQVGAHLIMRSSNGNKSSFKCVSLAATKVAGNVDFDEATLSGELNADLAAGRNAPVDAKGELPGSNAVRCENHR